MKTEQFEGLKREYQATAEAESAARAVLAKTVEKQQSLSKELDTLHAELREAKDNSADAMEKFLADAMDKEKRAKVRRAEAAAAERLSDVEGIISSLAGQIERQEQSVAEAAKEAKEAAGRYWLAVRAELGVEFRQMTTPLLERLAALSLVSGYRKSFAEIGSSLLGNRQIDQTQFQATKDELAAEHGVPLR